MSEHEGTTRGVELLLAEPEIVAWLSDYRPEPEEASEDDDAAGLRDPLLAEIEEATEETR